MAKPFISPPQSACGAENTPVLSLSGRRLFLFPARVAEIDEVSNDKESVRNQDEPTHSAVGLVFTIEGWHIQRVAFRSEHVLEVHAELFPVVGREDLQF